VAAIDFPASTLRRRQRRAAVRCPKSCASRCSIIAALCSSLGYGVMNLLMASTPIAMDQCGLPFSDTALVLEWHVIGMFAPGFFTGQLIKRFGVMRIMAVGVALKRAVHPPSQPLTGGSVAHASPLSLGSPLFLLGVGWNFLFTGATTLSLQAYAPEEKDRAQGALNFCVFAVLAVTSFASGLLVTTQGWALLNVGSLVPVALTAAALVWRWQLQRTAAAT